MEAVVAPISSKVTDELFDSIRRQIAYIWNFSSNIEDLRDKVEKLKDDKENLEHQVEKAKDKGETIEQNVNKWLQRVDDVIGAANEILEENENAEKSCFMGCSPNLKTRYRLTRKAKKLPIDELRQENNFNIVSHCVPAQKLPVPRDFEVFESRTKLMNEIVGALKDVGVDLVGVYGLPGVGKTTLMKQVEAQVKLNGIFKVVAKATVTHTPDLKKIQQEIADWLGLPFDVDSTEVRARRLRARLSQEEKALIILDDVWTAIKLDDIGIPFRSEHKGCKILVTSRDQSVLLDMEVQMAFHLQVLQHEEAWNLFETKVGDLKNSDLRSVATEVAKRCGGLPILIAPVAVALKGRELCEWQDALRALKRFDNEGEEKKAYKALELSYDFLNEEQKSVFLLCAQLGNDSTGLGDLLNYSIGLGLFKCDTVEETSNKLVKLANDLTRSCFLLKVNIHGYFQMHEVVHRFAVSLASKKHRIFTVANDTILENWPKKEALQDYMSISLPYVKIPMLPEEFECPQLESFLMFTRQDFSFTIPPNLFSRMKKLKLVDLTGMHLSPFPLSLRYLENLQTLCLNYCILVDIAAIGELKKLKVLSLSFSTIVRLPKEIGNLTCLQILELNECQRLEEIPPDVLSCLSKLEELRMRNSFVKWEGEGDYLIGNNANLGELEKLSNLATLDMHIVDAKIIPEDLFSKELKRFRILIGEGWNWYGNPITTRTLKLKLDIGPDDEFRLEKVKVLLRRTEDLYLDDMKGIESVVDELDGQGFVQLKHLHVQNSHDIQYIIGRKYMCDVTAFPNLESFCLENLNRLEKICNGPLMKGSLSNIRKLKVGYCNQLKNLLSLSTFRGLVKLEEIDVNSCKIMEEIVAEDEEEAIEFTEMHTLRLEHLPGFSCFSSKANSVAAASTSCKEIVSKEQPEASSLLFSEKVRFPCLNDLKLCSVKVKKIWINSLTKQFENLTSLQVEDCGNLGYLFTSCMVKNLSQLKVLAVSNCSSMQEIIKGEMGGSFLHELDFLMLKNLPKLERFCGGEFIECPLLNFLQIENCPNLHTFMSTSVSTSGAHANSILFDDKVCFPNLEEIHISYMHNTKMIWSDEVWMDSFCKLKIVRVEHGEQLLKVIPSKLLRRFQSVQYLLINDCKSLEEVFDIQMLIDSNERHDCIESQLRNLDIRNLPRLEHVWNKDPIGILSFKNLGFSIVKQCPRLESLFPASVARNFPRLEELNIERCGLEAIVAKEEEFEPIPKFEFPRLTCLVLWGLEKLKSFYNGRHTFKCPELKILSLYCCDKLEIFSSIPHHQDETGLETQPKLQFRQSFLSLTKVPKLEQLKMNWRHILVLKENQFPVAHLHKLKVLDLHFVGNDSAELLFDFLPKFQNLITLSLGNCDFKQLFPNDIAGEMATTLLQIRHLKLDVLPYLMHLWSQDSQQHHLLKNLETLTIWQCHGLLCLAPSSSSFQSLTFLEVFKCQGMVHLVSPSTVSSLVNLTSMILRECDQLKEIIEANEGDETQFQSTREIVLWKLATLKLHCLKSLTSFCSATCTIKLPSLEVASVTQCPNMKIFSQGLLIAPKLNRVYVTEEWDKWRWIGNFNTTIKNTYMEMVGFSGRQHLKLSEFPQLIEIWHDQLPVSYFYNLSKLMIDEYGFSSTSVPSNLLPSLNNLEELEVRNCNSVEQVFDLKCQNVNEYLGYLSNLNKLHLIDLPRLRCVWNEFPEANFYLKNLKILKVHRCSSLTHIFTAKVSLGLGQLEEIEVKSCGRVKEIIAKEVEATEKIRFPLLNSITLESLPDLISFNSGSKSVECPSLKQITISDCPSTFSSTFLRELESNEADGIAEPKVEFLNLKDLKLCWDGIKNIWNQKQLQMSSLSSLTVDGCGNLKYLLSSSVLEVLVHLKTLEICNCKLMEEIISMETFEEGRTSEIVLHKLEFLKLKNLQQLTQFCTCYFIECDALKMLWIENCPELETFISSSEISSKFHDHPLEIVNSTLFDEKVAFANLEELIIIGLSELSLIWHHELREDSFCKLKILRVEAAKKLVEIFPPNLLTRFLNVEILNIIGCDALEEVLDLQGLINGEEVCDVAASQLRQLLLWQLPKLKHVWNEDPEEILNFQYLSVVDVRDCPSLKSLFPAALARGLVHLQNLRIHNSAGIEDIVGWEEGTETADMFLFPELNSLILIGLPQLKRLYPEGYIPNWPQLKVLIVYLCDQLQQPFVSSFAKIIPDLECLALNSLDLRTVCEGNFAADSFQKLRYLVLNSFDEENAVYLFDVLQRFHNLETLEVAVSNFKELFPPEGIVCKEKYGTIIGKIRFLYLTDLANLNHIWNPNSQILQNLEHLWVDLCYNLIILVPSSASFQSLTSLTVRMCNRLVSLVTSSTAKSLVRLTELRVIECNMMKEIVSNEGDEIMDYEIIFIKLTTLKLSCLPRLTSFCSGNHSFKFPSLTRVIVEQCPMMEVFSEGVSTSRTPMLERVQLTEENDRGYWLGDLNSTMEYLHKKTVCCILWRKALEISEFINLKDKWHSELPVEFFSNLRSLVVDESAFSSCAIPSNLLVFLNNLHELDVCNCELLEQVFELQSMNPDQGHTGLLSKLNRFQLMNLPSLRHLWNEYPQGILNFKRLKSFKIHNCSSLRMIFTPSMARGLIHMQELEVKNCASVAEIITKVAEEAEGEEMILSLLNSLVLESLPKLTNIYSGRA